MATKQSFKWRSILGLIMVYVAVLMDWEWVWGLLFLFWVVPDLFTGITYFMEPIEKKQSPVLYWSVMVSWILMCVYMVTASFFPQMINYGHKVANPPSIHAKSVGTYQPERNNEQAVIPVSTNNLAEKQVKKVVNQKVATTQKAPLKYKTYSQKNTEYFVGISTETTFEQNLHLTHLQELWDYFLKNDISPAIPNIVDEKVFVIYSDYEQPASGKFKITIGFRTENIDNIYEGLTGIAIPPVQFAVFESEKDPENFPAEMWPKVFDSDLNRANTFDLEVYSLDANYEVEKAELRIALK
ncbi:MAG: effector binding domain-containing protein [Bacteroidota bacterium]